MAITQTKKLALFFVVAFCCLLLGCFEPQRVSAQTMVASASTIIAPTFQEITLPPEADSQTAQIEVTNQNDQAQSFDLFAIDVDQIDSQGNVIFSDKPLANADSPRSAFVTFPESTVEILPNQTKTIPFTVTNAQNMPPGGNYVVLVLRAQSTTDQLEASQSVLPAISSFVLIRKLGGELYNLSLSRITTSGQFLWGKLPASVNLLFENQGNIHTIPRGQITIVDMFGRAVLEATINESSQFVYPRTQREIVNQLRQIRPSWPIMLYSITVQGRSDPGENSFLQQAMVLFISPLFALTVLGLTTIGAIGVIKVRRIKKNKRAIETT